MAILLVGVCPRISRRSCGGILADPVNDHAGVSGASRRPCRRAIAKWRFRLRPIDPTGKSPKVCPSLCAKRFRLTRRANQSYQLAPSHPMRGALRTSRTRGGMRWTRSLRTTNASPRGRRSRVVLAPRCWRQARERRFRVWRVMVAKQPGHQGEREVSRNTIAQGRLGCLR